MVITRPNHDLTTTYLSTWSESLITETKKRGGKVADLFGRRANRREFESVIRKTKPALVVMNGHGSADSVTGYDNVPLVVVDDNEKILSDAVVYARSCQSASKLEPSCITHGTRAYIGYTEDFVFFIDEQTMTRPLRDTTAKLFLEPANHIVVSLLKGHSVKEANIRSKQMYADAMRHLSTSETPKELQELVPYLRWNMVHQVCIGDAGITV